MHNACILWPTRPPHSCSHALPSQQMSFGLHILAMMAAFYAFGHVAGMAITSNRAVVRGEHWQAGVHLLHGRVQAD